MRSIFRVGRESSEAIVTDGEILILILEISKV